MRFVGASFGGMFLLLSNCGDDGARPPRDVIDDPTLDGSVDADGVQECGGDTCIEACRSTSITTLTLAGVDFASGDRARFSVSTDVPATVMRPEIDPRDVASAVTWTASLVNDQGLYVPLADSDFPRSIAPGFDVQFEFWLNGSGAPSLGGSFIVLVLWDCSAAIKQVPFGR